MLQITFKSGLNAIRNSGTEEIPLCRGFDSHRGQEIFSLPRVVPCFPLLGLTPSGLCMGLSSTLIYTSELVRTPILEETLKVRKKNIKDHCPEMTVSGIPWRAKSAFR